MIDQKIISHIAQLSKLSLAEKEREEFGAQLSKVLAYFEQISQVDTKNVRPLVTPTEMTNHWRDDAVIKLTTVEEIMENAPDKTGHLFTVPPVVG